MSELRYDGKVAVVTGAGNGLGRAHALAFAKRGAKVVVNDLGGSHTGEGKSATAADKVVAEIEAMGGKAVANHDSVENGEAIVKTAMDAFGRIDVLVNNAGILRDVSFAKMTEQDWNLIDKVHVYGAFKCSHAVWPIMRDQKFGRILFTSSAAGLYGNFGQANYSMAKLGLVGLMQTLAIEGKKNNVFANAIAPVAGSRMTETVLPQDLLDALKPEYVTELVMWLCNEKCEETGGTFEVGGGFYGKLRWERTKGRVFRLGRPVSAEDIQAGWGDVTNFEGATHPQNITAALEPIMDNVKAGPSKGGNQFVDVDQALGYQFPEMTSRYDERDLALYALGVGAAEDPLDANDLKLVYELNGEGFVGLPTYGVVPAINCIFELGKQGKTAPGMNYGLDRVLHGEQYLEVLRPLPPKAKLTHKATIKSIYDKGSEGGKKGGAVVITAFESKDESGEVLFRNEVSTFVKGAGGWGGDRGPDEKNLNASPDRAPDKSVEQKIHQNQALLYRLSGDWNPLHADPSFAKAFGFEKPILHGLCTFGYAARHVISSFAPKGDARLFKSIKVRFADPVLPGETIVTEMWKDSETKILFRVKSKDRDKVVISNGAVELYTEIPKPKAKPAAAAASAGGGPVVPNSTDVFAGISAFLTKEAGTGDRIKTVFQFKLKNPDATWTIDLSSGNGSVAQGESAPPGCTLEISDADFMDMCTGKADAMKLFTGGKLKITGNIMASQKLDFLKKVDPNDVMASAQKRSGGSAGAAAAATSAEPTSTDVFGGIAKYLAKTGGQGDKIKTVFQFKLKNPDATWTIDLASGDGKVGQGETAAPGCTLEISDADFMDMCTGKADAMKLFTGGKLKITGNIMASQKLDFLRKVDPSDVLAAMKERGGGGGAAAAPAAPAASAEPTSTDVFGGISKYLAKTGGQGDKIKTVFQFKLKSPDAVWTIDLSGGDGKVGQGETAPPGCTLEISDADFMDMCTGKADAMKLFSGGKLKITGNIMASQKLDFLRKVDPNDVLASMKERVGSASAGGGGGGAAKPAPASSAGGGASKAKDIAKKIGERMAANANLASEVGALIELRVKDPEAIFTVDLKNGPGGIKEGKADKPDAILTVADADLVTLTTGAESLKSLYQHGKVRVDGDAKVVRKLAFLEKIG
ncbi:MAG: SDR family NAD(P)-dependent oxidoreductase [Deltaproteobacteria bacterium]|nr:SDR family NAD(P)-dependent oxidoreductase [Deltaproteobacteria bacterium]